MDYRNLELLAQKEWGHINPKLLKAWTESSLARNSSNTMCLPCHSWAIALLKVSSAPGEKEAHEAVVCSTRCYSAALWQIPEERKGRGTEPKPLLHYDPPMAEEPHGYCFGSGQPEDGWAFSEGPHLRTAAVSCSQSCFMAPLKLVELWLTQCLSVCAHKGERAGAGSCAQMQAVNTEAVWGVMPPAPVFCASPWLCPE